MEYAFHRLFEAPDSSKRFLIADEVGLGKTLIARGVLAKVLERLKDDVQRIDIVYVCSNLAIAAQNIARLNPLPDRKFADAERITLLPLHLKQLSENHVNFVAFTPGTSLNLGNSLGTARERLLLYTLLSRGWNLRGVSALNLLQGNVADADYFRLRAKEMSEEDISPGLERAFFRALDDNAEIRSTFDAACERFSRQRNYDEEDRRVRNRVVGSLRRLLAQTCIGALEPDLIVLDEFQRFKSLFDPETEEGELASELFEWSDAQTSARVLLLSATPYKAYTLQHESAEDDHYEDFLRTVRFLENDAAKTDVLKAMLLEHRKALFAISDTDARDLIEVKSRIESHLRRVISRTERLSAGKVANGMLRSFVKADLSPSVADLRAYAAMRALTDELEAGDSIEYWKSAAYALNFMEGYQLRRALEARMEEQNRIPKLVEAFEKSRAACLPLDQFRGYQQIEPLPNARLRELMRQLSEQGAFDLLWLPPSLPYYSLNGRFADAGRLTKRLVFSAWNMVPRSLASLLSYECERRAFSLDESDPKNTPEARKNRRGLLRFSQSDGRLTGMPVFSLLYPCSELARLCDPREFARQNNGAAASPAQVLEWAIERVKIALPPEMQYAAENEAADEKWYWAAPVLMDRDADGSIATWWQDRDLGSRWAGSGEDGERDEEADVGWAQHVAAAKQQAIEGRWPDGVAPHDLPRVLALIGLAGPATCALRALGRLFDTSPGDQVIAMRNAAARIGWAFRSLYNRPEALALVRRGRSNPYWTLALEYGFEGCLSSVLEEYLHVLRDSRGLTFADAETACPDLAEAAVAALQIRTASLDVDDYRIDADRQNVSVKKEAIRSLFAMRFGSDKTEDQDRVRRDSAVSAAFNSPFWPFVLATTSVGQEGLDFHWYCHAVVHWNIPSNPVDLEQREGRVHRFKGHAVRKNVARVHGDKAIRAPNPDLWTELFRIARADGPSDERGLVPYWLYPVEDGAWIERHVLLFPFSRDEARYKALQRSLGAYRMVFGQPRQDELLAYLLNRVDERRLMELSDSLRIDLTPPRRTELAEPKVGLYPT